MTTNEIETAVMAILKDAGTSYKIHSAGQNLVRDGWECDGWRAELTNGRFTETFDYFTGLGHRAPVTDTQRIAASYEFQGLTVADKKGATNYGKRYLKRVQELRKPQPPHIAGVLHSLILDASARNESFPDWCANFGYDDDSIKALNTYKACCEEGNKLSRVVPRDALVKLSEVLQDY